MNAISGNIYDSNGNLENIVDMLGGEDGMNTGVNVNDLKSAHSRIIGSDGKSYFLADLLKKFGGNEFTDEEKEKVAGVELGANKTVIDKVLSTLSGNPVTNAAVTNALDKKVDKITGKVLSTNDYTTTEKNKLESIVRGSYITTIATDQAAKNYIDLPRTVFGMTSNIYGIPVYVQLGEIGSVNAYVTGVSYYPGAASYRVNFTGITGGGVRFNWFRFGAVS